MEQFVELVSFKNLFLSKQPHRDAANDNEAKAGFADLTYSQRNLLMAGTDYQPAGSKSWWLP